MKAGVPGFSGERLRQAREAMGLTMTSLAHLVDISKQAISQFEKGVDGPSPEIFDRLKNILRHEAHFFLRAPLSGTAKGICFYRSLAAATKAARTKAEVWQLWVREFIHYLAEYIEIPPSNFPKIEDLPLDPNMLGMDAIESFAGRLRDHWRLGNGPIPNLTMTAESNGVLIVRHTLDATTLDALSEWLQPERWPLVVLNADKNVAVRSRLDLAHEIGHLLLHENVSRDSFIKPEMFNLIEDQAFRFGAALLLPEHSFLNDLYSISLDGLRALKPKWKVSVAMMIQRLKDLRIVNEDQYKRLRINYSVKHWNKQEPLDFEIKVEKPTFMAEAVQALIADNIQTPEQIVVNTGLTKEWISRLLDFHPDFLSRKPTAIKVLEFRRA